MPESISIGILIGGLSRRMGRPKALIEVGGRTLIERTVDVARGISTDVMLLGEPPFEMPTALKGIKILPDRAEGIGPIGGLDALMTSRMGRDCLLLACDMPRVSGAVLMKIAENAGDFDGVAPRTGDVAKGEVRLHPCCALYRASAMEHVAAAIRAREFAMMKLISRARMRVLDLDGDAARALDNWNTPEDAGSG